MSARSLLPSLLTLAVLCGPASTAPVQTPLPPLSSAAQPAEQIFRDTNSTSLVFVAVRGSDVWFQSFGETAPGNHQLPTTASTLRLCSVTKVFAADLLVQLSDQKIVHPDDPLQHFAPPGAHVPTTGLHGARGVITLRDLATHTAGLPRELGTAPHGTPHFTFPDYHQRWQFLEHQKLLASPGTAASYSNLGFDLLGDALASAAHRPYPQLLAERITTPLGMRDTTFVPSPSQCARLLRGPADEGPCTDTTASAGSSGLYSTPANIALWLRYLLHDPALPLHQSPVAQQDVFLPAQLRSVLGLSHAGPPSGIGLAWVRLGPARLGPPRLGPARLGPARLGPRGSPSVILQKTGAGAGFATYIALNPANRTAVFFAMMEGAGGWHTNPFEAANNILLSLCNLPPLPPDHVRPSRKPMRRTHTKAGTRPS
jgi:D-alanyl-D-alanine-carboxypeptidase/D-alanyl-D-alanine-endopeptidase